MNSSSLTCELLKSSSESRLADVEVTGVAGRAAVSAASGVFFLRGPSAAPSLLERSDALRLRAVGGVVIWYKPGLVDDETRLRAEGRGLIARWRRKAHAGSGTGAAGSTNAGVRQNEISQLGKGVTG